MREVFRWVVLAVVVGVVVGVVACAFLKALYIASRYAGGHDYYWLGLPLALLICGWAGERLFPRERFYSTDRIIQAIHYKLRVGIPSVLKCLLLPVLTIGSGGSAGKEAPVADAGAGVGYWLGTLLKVDEEERRRLMVCGVSAGFAATFGTPIAGALFGTEVLYIGEMLYGVLLPAFISGMVAYHIASWLGTHFFVVPVYLEPPFSGALFLQLVVAGLFFGLCSLVVVETHFSVGVMIRRLRLPVEVRAVLGGMVIILLTFFTSPLYLGLGTEHINTFLVMGAAPSLAFFFKALATALTIHSGGHGGLVTPLFFIGVAAGCAFANLLGWDASVFGALGMAAILAGTANTPIAASVMAMELFGLKLGSYATIVCTIAFLIVGHRSLFPSQKLAIVKSRRIRVPIGEEVGRAVVEVQEVVTLEPPTLLWRLLDLVGVRRRNGGRQRA